MKLRGRKPSTKTLVDRQLGRNRQTPTPSQIDNSFLIPNHSGDHSAGILIKTPTKDIDLINKKYVDNNFVKKSGDTMTGDLTIQKAKAVLTLDSNNETLILYAPFINFLHNSNSGGLLYDGINDLFGVTGTTTGFKIQALNNAGIVKNDSNGVLSSLAKVDDLNDFTYPTHTNGDIFYSDGTNIVKLTAYNGIGTAKLTQNATTKTLSWTPITTVTATNYDKYTSRIDNAGGLSSGSIYATVSFDTSLLDSGDITYSSGVFTIGTTGNYEITFTASFVHSSGTTGGIADFILQDDSSGSYTTIQNVKEQYAVNGAGCITMKIMKSYSVGDKIRIRHKDTGDSHTILAKSMTMNIRQISKA